MDIFESLENLPISEACFDEIMDMVEELIDEVLVGDYKEKGAGEGEADIKRELQKHFGGKLRGIRKHAEKANKGREKEAKELHNQIKGQEEKTDVAREKWYKSSDASHQAFQDYKQAQDGTPLKDKLLKKWDELSDKGHKSLQKYNKEEEKGRKLEGERGELLDAAYNDEEKRKKASKLMSKYGSDDGKDSMRNVHNIAWNGSKNKGY